MKNEKLDSDIDSEIKSDNLENEKVKSENSEQDIYKIIQSMSDCV